jgi:transposase-like protein
MENTHISLQKWFLAILLMSRDKRGVSALELARDLDISDEKARHMALNIKSAMSARESTYTLSGNVEMDEFYIGAPGGKQGRGTTKTPVLIAVTFDFVTDQKNKLNRYPNFMKMKALAVGEVNGENILEFCERYIEKGSTIYSDGAKVYNVLQENGYILHGEKFNAETNPMAMVHTAISNCKSYLSGTYHGSYQENIQLYLDEFSYRYNRRKMHENICERIYEIAATEAKVFRSRNHGKSEAGE